MHLGDQGPAARFMLVTSLFFCILVRLCQATGAVPQSASLPQALVEVIVPEIIPHLYSYKTGYFYLPTGNDDKTLFDRVSPETVSKIMAADNGKYKCMFLVPILRDYIIPYFLQGIVPSEEVFKTLPKLPYIFEALGNVVDQFLWAIFLSSGSVKKLESLTLRIIINKFKKLGFAWQQLRSGLGRTAFYKDNRSKRVTNLLPIYYIAKCFGVDIIRIASLTANECALSRMIERKVVPIELRLPEEFTSMQIFYAIFEGEPTKYCHYSSQKGNLRIKGLKPSLELCPDYSLYTSVSLPTFKTLTESVLEARRHFYQHEPPLANPNFEPQLTPVRQERPVFVPIPRIIAQEPITRPVRVLPPTPQVQKNRPSVPIPRVGMNRSITDITDRQYFHNEPMKRNQPFMSTQPNKRQRIEFQSDTLEMNTTLYRH